MEWIKSVVVLLLVLFAGTAMGAATESPADYVDPTTGMQFVWVPGGCYQMGNTADDSPWHEVCVDGLC